MWAVRRRSNGLYAGFVQDWTDRLAEVCYFETQTEAEEYRSEYTWEPDTYLAFQTSAIQFVKLQLANITDERVRANIIDLIQRLEG